MSYSKPANTFRFCAATQRAAVRASLGSPTFGHDFAYAAKRNRFIRQHVAEHGPTSIANGFRHFRLRQSGRAHVSNVNFRMLTNDIRRGHVEEMFALVSDFRRQGTGTSLLSARLKLCQVPFSGAVEAGRGDLFAGRKCSEVFQSKINPDSIADARRNLRQLDLNVDVPSAARITGKLPRLGLTSIRDWARQPQSIGSAKHGQISAIKFRRTLEIGERHEIKIALVGPEPRRFRKACVPRIGKLAANRVDRVGVQSQFSCDAAAEIGEIEGVWALDGASRLPSRVCLAVDLTAIIPDEINRTGLRSEGVSRSVRTVLDAILECQDHARHIISLRGGFKCYSRNFIRNAEMLMKRFGYLVLILFSHGAHAHDLDCIGRPVPTSTKWFCCSNAEHHLLSADQARENSDGSWTVKINSYIITVPKERALPSEDGCWHIFFDPGVEDRNGHPFPYCFFWVPGV
jgi:hypothetical protein